MLTHDTKMAGQPYDRSEYHSRYHRFFVFYSFIFEQTRIIIPFMRKKRDKNFTNLVAQRLTNFVLETLKLNTKEWADLLQCDISMVYRVTKGKSLPDLDGLVAIWAFSRERGTPLNFEWLLTGQASLNMSDNLSNQQTNALRLMQQIDEDELNVFTALLTQFIKKKKE